MQSFDLSLGFYAVLGKPVAHDLTLILLSIISISGLPVVAIDAPFVQDRAEPRWC